MRTPAVERVEVAACLASAPAGTVEARPLVSLYLLESAGPARSFLAQAIAGAQPGGVPAALERIGARRDDPLSLAALQALLRDDRTVCRHRAVCLLGERSGDARAAAALQRVLAVETDEGVLRSAVRALGALGCASADRALHCYVRGTRVPMPLRLEAARVIGPLGDEEACRLLAGTVEEGVGSEDGGAAGVPVSLQ